LAQERTEPETLRGAYSLVGKYLFSYDKGEVAYMKTI
jgi:hypothetical protein